MAKLFEMAMVISLLSKVMNHSTTRSHVYIVFLKVDFFEVVDDTPGDGVDNPKIGAKLADSPGHRGIFIIDVSDPAFPVELPRVLAEMFSFS